MGSDTLVTMSTNTVQDNTTNTTVTTTTSFIPVENRKYLDFEVLNKPEDIVETYVHRRKKTK